MFIKVVCAWCGCYMGIKKLNTNDGAGPSVSHGICPECIPKATVEMEKTAFRIMKLNQNKENKNE
jgi:hypothetical protein